MMTEEGDSDGLIDGRSAMFVGLTPENLATLAKEWPVTASTPSDVADLLRQSRRLFVGAAFAYDNFVQCALVCLQAAERGLAVRLGPSVRPKATLGQLIEEAEKQDVLSGWWLDWYREFALHFRNMLSHPKEAPAFTPGFAEPIMRTGHEAVAALFPK